MTIKPWRLTRRAERALEDICDWTLEHFGARQAKTYEDDLIAHLLSIADGTAFSQSCQRLLGSRLPKDVRFTRCGGHFVIFVEHEGAVIIFDIIHAKSDLPGRIARLSTNKGN